MRETEKSAKEIAAEPVHHPDFDQFVATIAALRAPDGCPWDKVQTHASIAHNMIEEAYETIDCIEANDTVHLREELGDVLLQVVLHSQIAADAGQFDIDEVCAEVNDKIVRRHPHVFGENRIPQVAGTSSEGSAAAAGEVLDLWDKVKLAERSENEAQKGLLDSIPRSMPALMQAQKISRKAVAVGFEWPDINAVWRQTEEEIDELKEAYRFLPKEANGRLDQSVDCDKSLLAAAELELGDVLFSLVNVARYMGLDAESALRASCEKFRARWAFMEKCAADAGKDCRDFSTEELEEFWQQAKCAGLNNCR